MSEKTYRERCREACLKRADEAGNCALAYEERAEIQRQIYLDYLPFEKPRFDGQGVVDAADCRAARLRSEACKEHAFVETQIERQYRAAAAILEGAGPYPNMAEFLDHPYSAQCRCVPAKPVGLELESIPDHYGKADSVVSLIASFALFVISILGAGSAVVATINETWPEALASYAVAVGAAIGGFVMRKIRRECGFSGVRGVK